MPLAHLTHALLTPWGFQGNLHDRYGQLVTLYSKLLCTKLKFHTKVNALSLMFYMHFM